VKVIRKLISPHFRGVDVNTVDGFQVGYREGRKPREQDCRREKGDEEEGEGGEGEGVKLKGNRNARREKGEEEEGGGARGRREEKE
jgi:hypothetical protein